MRIIARSNATLAEKIQLAIENRRLIEIRYSGTAAHCRTARLWTSARARTFVGVSTARACAAGPSCDRLANAGRDEDRNADCARRDVRWQPRTIASRPQRLGSALRQSEVKGMAGGKYSMLLATGTDSRRCAGRPNRKSTEDRGQGSGLFVPRIRPLGFSEKMQDRLVPCPSEAFRVALPCRVAYGLSETCLQPNCGVHRPQSRSSHDSHPFDYPV